MRSESGLEVVTGLMTVTEGLWIARNPFPKIVGPRYERVTYRRTFIGGLRWCSQAVSSTVIQGDSGPRFLSEIVTDTMMTRPSSSRCELSGRYARMKHRMPVRRSMSKRTKVNPREQQAKPSQWVSHPAVGSPEDRMFVSSRSHKESSRLSGGDAEMWSAFDRLASRTTSGPRELVRVGHLCRLSKTDKAFHANKRTSRISVSTIQ